MAATSKKNSKRAEFWRKLKARFAYYESRFDVDDNDEIAICPVCGQATRFVIQYDDWPRCEYCGTN